MTRRAALALALAVLPGCPVLAPVVGGSPPGEGESVVCDPGVRCERLAEPPPGTFDESALRIDDDACPTRVPMALTLTTSTVLDATTLACATLDVTVAPPPGAELPTLTLRGETLADARVHVASSDALAQLDVDVDQVSGSRLEVEGAVRVTVAGARVDTTWFVLGGAEPIGAPELLVSRSFVGDVGIRAPRSPVRLRDTSTRRTLLDARSIALERGVIETASLHADLIELLDARASATRFDASRMIVTGGRMASCEVARCDSLTLASTQVNDSRVAACTDPVDAETAAIGGSTLLGAITGADDSVVRTVIGGDVDVERSTLLNVALCGASRVHASALSCILCAPSAPHEVCAETLVQVAACPGLCGSECDAGAPPRSVLGAECAE